MGIVHGHPGTLSMRWVPVVALLSVVAACGGGGAGSPDPVSTTSSVVAAADGSTPDAGAPDTGAPVTSPPTLPSPTTVSASTAPPATTAPPASTAPPATVGTGLSLACLQGEWLLKPDRTDLFLATLVPFAPLSVPGGSISMTITGTQVVTYWNIVVRFTVPNGVVEAPLDLRQVGTAAIDGGSLVISGTTTEGGWGRFTGTLGGVAVDVPVPPVGDIPAMTGGPTQCAGSELSMQFTSGASDAVAYFERVP